MHVGEMNRMRRRCNFFLVRGVLEVEEKGAQGVQFFIFFSYRRVLEVEAESHNVLLNRVRQQIKKHGGQTSPLCHYPHTCHKVPFTHALNQTTRGIVERTPFGKISRVISTLRLV